MQDGAVNFRRHGSHPIYQIAVALAALLVTAFNAGPVLFALDAGAEGGGVVGL